MSATGLHVPIFSDLVPGGFRFGGNYLIEFAANSLWYEASLTIASKALKAGIRTQYHTFMHIPKETRQHLEKHVPNLGALEDKDVFRLIDSYTGLTGLPVQREPGRLIPESSSSMTDSDFPFEDVSSHAYLENFATQLGKLLATGPADKDKRWLHIDDNTSMFNRHFREEEVLKIFHTRVFQLTRFLELSAFHSVVSGVFSDGFYKQFEAQCDGVIDFKAEDNEGQLENYVRVRTIQGLSCDSRWRRTHLTDGGEVELDAEPQDRKKGIGISGWLKGPKK